MRQEDLLVKVMSMKPGQRIDIGIKSMLSCAEGSIRSILLDGPARKSDIDEFVRNIERNWNVSVICDEVGQIWKICKK